ncbi:MAG: pilus assembly protein TadG-related protein [Nitrospinota bacterium]
MKLQNFRLGALWDRLFSKGRGTKGQIVAIVALALPAIAGGAALAVDVGHIFVAKSAIQTAVDAGARAGTAVLAEGGSQAATTASANSFVSQNLSTIPYLATITPVISFPTSESVKVTIEHNLSLYFARVLGIETAPIANTATAALPVFPPLARTRLSLWRYAAIMKVDAPAVWPWIKT